MAKAVVAALVMILGAAALVLAAMKFYEKTSDSCLDEGINGITAAAKLRKIYNDSASTYKPWNVVYISIYKQRLKSMAEYSKVVAVNELVQSAIENAVHSGLFDGAALLDGNNYVLLTKANGASVENFCEKFMLRPSDETGAKSVWRYASVLDIHIGAYTQISKDITFENALDNARRAAKYALETHSKYCMSTHAVQTKVSEMEAIEAGVDKLIDNNEFYMVIQPFIGKDGEILGGEMLSRFRPVDGKDVSLHKYLRAIRKVELSGKFDFAVFEKCLSWQECKGCERIGLISCNFTRYSASQADFLDNIRSIVGKYNVKTENIAIEITEDDFEVNRERLLENVNGLKQMGFLIFIDDFGSGAASVDDLYSMPADVLKLDKSLLRHCGTKRGKAIFCGICAIARELGMKVLCEGIENEYHAAFADRADCDIMQGYYYYRPMPISEYERLCDGKGDSTQVNNF